MRMAKRIGGSLLAVISGALTWLAYMAGGGMHGFREFTRHFAVDADPLSYVFGLGALMLFAAALAALDAKHRPGVGIGGVTPLVAGTLTMLLGLVNENGHQPPSIPWIVTGAVVSAVGLAVALARPAAPVASGQEASRRGEKGDVERKNG
jgi:hypothetical protein